MRGTPTPSSRRRRSEAAPQAERPEPPASTRRVVRRWPPQASPTEKRHRGMRGRRPDRRAIGPGFATRRSPSWQVLGRSTSERWAWLDLQGLPQDASLPQPPLRWTRASKSVSEARAGPRTSTPPVSRRGSRRWPLWTMASRPVESRWGGHCPWALLGCARSRCHWGVACGPRRIGGHPPRACRRRPIEPDGGRRAAGDRGRVVASVLRPPSSSGRHTAKAGDPEGSAHDSAP